jgi:sugar lactone lactonase YvrE
VPPDGSWLNDVVGLRDGGFFVTHMMPRRGGIGQFVEFAKAGLLGMETGHVLAWQQGSGFEPVPGTETTFANGLALSSDGETLFVNSSLGGGVRRVSLREGRVEARAEVPGLDNATWATDGRLWVASLTSMTDVTRCGDLERGACPAAFRIVAVDPETMQTEIIYEGEGPPMGGGTVGLQVGDELFIGSFAGDRILRVRLGG